MNKFDQMTKETEARMLRVGKKLQQKSLPFVKWNSNTNTFEINDKSVLYSQWIALADEATVGWVKWNHNFTKVEQKTPTVCIYSYDEPPKPEGDGAKDLWRLQFELPLQQIETGELAIFNVGYDWGRQAIGAVIEYFAKTHRRPIVQLEVRDGIKDGKTITIGALDIVGPDESDDFVVDLTKGGVNISATGNSATAPKLNADMDDVMPF